MIETLLFSENIFVNSLQQATSIFLSSYLKNAIFYNFSCFFNYSFNDTILSILQSSVFSNP